MPTGDSEHDFPRFRAFKTVCIERDGKTYFRNAAAISSISEEDAEAHAREIARQRCEDAIAGNKPEQNAGTYPYPERILVEPVLERIQFTDTTGERELARITRNGYDARVINAYQAMFVDVDTAPETGTNPRTGEKTITAAAVSEADAMAALAALVQSAGNLAFRIYATKAGMRYLCTNRLFDPTAPETLALMRGLKSDPRYVTLCRVQKCFRARLTPKPWRCEFRETIERKGFLGKLLGGTTTRLVTNPERFATCNFIDQIGTGNALPEIEKILELHDRETGAHSGKPLA